MTPAQPTIILPLDGSDLSNQARDLAVAIASRANARLTLVTAPEVYGLDMAWYTGAAPEATLPMVPITELMAEARRAAADFLAAQQAALEPQGLTVSTVVIDDMPARAIVQAAEDEEAWLIVMATHGRGGLTRWALGSVADKVLQTAAAPVLVVRAGTRHITPDFDQILVPLDGSRLAEAVLPSVTRLATAFGSLVTLAFVSQEARLGMETAKMTEAQQREVERMAAYLAEQVERLRAAGVTAESEMLAGENPAEVLLHRVGRGDIDLVALTTHGRGGLSRWAYGSVADRLIRHADSPTLILRSQASHA